MSISSKTIEETLEYFPQMLFQGNQSGTFNNKVILLGTWYIVALSTIALHKAFTLFRVSVTLFCCVRCPISVVFIRPLEKYDRNNSCLKSNIDAALYATVYQITYNWLCSAVANLSKVSSEFL